MAKSKKLRAAVERLYAEINNVSVEHSHKILIHNKKLYEEYKAILTKGGDNASQEGKRWLQDR